MNNHIDKENKESNLPGKRKSEYPLEGGVLSKKQKTTSARSKTEFHINHNPNIEKVTITRTASTKSRLNSSARSTSKQFKPNCLESSLQKNLESTKEKSKKLEYESNKLYKLNEETKHLVLDELIKKNLDLLEVEGLIKHLHELQKQCENKNKEKTENNARIKATKEFAIGNLEKSRKVLEDIQSKKIQLENKIVILNEQTQREEDKVILTIYNY